MKTFPIVLAVAAVILSTEARAQWQPGVGGAGDVLAGILIGGAAVDGLVGVGGLVAGTGTFVQVGRGANAKPWWIASLALAGANTALGLLWTGIAADNFWDKGFLGLALAHAGVAAFDIVAAVIGITHRPPVEPTVVSGRDSAGHQWAGLGVRLASF